MSYLKYTSPLKDYDHKDKLIAQLRSDIYELQQNEKDFNDLNSQLKNLEYRYSLLQEEKERVEYEFRNRSDINLKLVASLRTEIDSLKAYQSEKNLEIQTLKSEISGAQQIAESRGNDINKLKQQLELSEDNQKRLEDDLTRNESNLNNMKEEKRSLLNELDNLNELLNEENEKCNELERIINESNLNIKNLESQNFELETKVVKFEKFLLESDRHKQEKDLEISSLKKQLQVISDESAGIRKSLQDEKSGNKELNHLATTLESNLRNKENAISSMKKEIENLNRNYNEAIENNISLSQELEISQKKIDDLVNHGKELNEIIRENSEKDGQILALLAKKQAYSEIKKKHESAIKSILLE